MSVFRRLIPHKPKSRPHCFALIVASVGLTISACGCSHQVQEEALVARKVHAVHPHVGNMIETLNAEGVLIPRQQATISARVSEPIRKFYVQRGSRVRAGDLIAVLERGDLEATAIADRGAYDAAQGAYDTAIGSTIPNEVQHALLEVTEARRRLRILEDSLDNVQLMFTRGVTSGRTLEAARLDYAQAQSAFTAANTNYEDLLRRQKTTAVTIARGQLEIARGRKLQSEQQLGYADIRSPISGTVLDRPASPGDTIAVGAPVATIADISSLLVKVHLGLEAAQHLTAGANATILVPGIATPLAAKVRMISPALDPGSTTVEVWLQVANPAGALKPGTPVHASIDLLPVAGALLISTSAIQHAEGVPDFVFVVGPDGVAHRRSVQTGAHTAETTQILSGLRNSDVIIDDPGASLGDGTSVTLVGTGIRG